MASGVPDEPKRLIYHATVPLQAGLVAVVHCDLL